MYLQQTSLSPCLLLAFCLHVFHPLLLPCFSEQWPVTDRDFSAFEEFVVCNDLFGGEVEEVKKGILW